jgi:transcriptional regulator with XRE-family HTH domain
VPVDARGGNANTRAVALGQAIQQALDDRRQTQRWLAERVGIDASGISRLIKGEENSTTLERVRLIEEVLELRAGALLIAAGYVEEVDTPEALLQADGTLPRLSKDVLLAAIEAARAAARESRR